MSTAMDLEETQRLTRQEPLQETLAWGRICVKNALDVLEMLPQSSSLILAIGQLKSFLRESEQLCNAKSTE